jgi:hypothetical protein
VKRIKVLSAVTLLLAAEVFAAGYSSSVSIVGIETVDTSGTARAYLTFTTRPHTTSCSTDSNPVQEWRLGGNAENQKNMMAVALAARLAERPVRVLFVDSYAGTVSCDSGGTTGYPVASGLLMQ